MRTVTELYRGWEFFDGNDHDCIKPNSTRRGIPVTIPHDWQRLETIASENSVLQGFLKLDGIKYYRRNLHIALVPHHVYQLQFDAVYEDCVIFINGRKAGHNGYGFIPFTLDITQYLHEGDNTLAVRVNNTSQVLGRWYSGAGIIRSARLIETPETHFAEYGTRIRWRLSTVDIDDENIPCADIDVTALYTGPDADTCHLKGTVLDGNCTKGMGCAAPGNQRLSLGFCAPTLWSAETPYLYTVQIDLIDKNKTVLDTITRRIGIRDVQWIPHKGLRVNDQPVKLKGACMHADGGSLGAAVPKCYWRKRLETLKAIGFNAIRTSHNPYPDEFLDLCDELGFYVLDECFDHWKTWGGSAFFAKDWKKILDTFVWRDVSRPSVILWSVGNEVENQASDDMLALLDKLTTRVRKIDDTRPVVCCLSPAFVDVPGDESLPNQIRAIVKIAPHVDVVCLNYQELRYPLLEKLLPDKLIIGTEVHQYFTAPTAPRIMEERHPWSFVKDDPSVVGCFIWVAVDYLGETTVFPCYGRGGSPVSSNLKRRPLSWMLQSYWTTKPFVHIAFFDRRENSDPARSLWLPPRLAQEWDFSRKDNPVEFMIFSNCQEVSYTMPHFDLDWAIIDVQSPRYKMSEQPNGVLKGFLHAQTDTLLLEGYDNGQKVCGKTLTRIGPPDHLKATTDGTTIRNDVYDVATLHVALADAADNICYFATSLIRFSVVHGGKVIATDNGNMSEFHPLYASECKLFRGDCTAYIQPDEDATEIAVCIQCEGFEDVVMRWEVMCAGR